jgi:glycosyltransferase involved in cell wall biosynthesis
MKPAQSAEPISDELNRPQLSLVLPCYNEQDVIRNTVERLVTVFRSKKVNFELILVDNGSADATGRIIDELITEGMPIIKEAVKVNQGYGNGVLRGLQACRGKLVGFICADGQVSAEDVFKVYDLASHVSSPKLVKVRRRFRMDGLKRKVVSIAYNLGANILFGGLGSIDINGNPKIFPREYLQLMQLECRDWFLDAEVMIKAKRLKLPVLEFNVLGQMREGGASSVRTSTCWQFVANLLRWRFAAVTTGAESFTVPSHPAPKP